MLYEPIEWVKPRIAQNGLPDYFEYLDKELQECEGLIECNEFHRLAFYSGSDMVFPPYLEKNGIEYVSPYTDLRLIDFVMGQTSLHLIHDWKKLPKSLLRAAQKGAVPDAVRLRPKSEFHFDGFQVSLFRENEAYLRSLLLADEKVLGLGWFHDRKSCTHLRNFSSESVIRVCCGSFH